MNIQVYTADVTELEDSQLYQVWYSRVCPARREKIDRIRFDSDKRLSLGAGALLEIALRVNGIQDFTLQYGENGKPQLAGRQDIQFNLSHSGTRVMCAVSDCGIGCDVERIRDIDLKLARRFFFSEEYEALARCGDSAHRNDLFFRYWTLKESFMKATGLGFSLPLDAFCMILDGDMVSVRQSVDSRRYYFHEYNRGDGYRYALCSVEKPIDGAGMADFSFQAVIE